MVEHAVRNVVAVVVCSLFGLLKFPPIQQLRVAYAGGLFIRKSCNGPYKVRQLTSVKSLHALFARPPKDLRHQINNHGITQIRHGLRNGAKISARKVIRKQLGAG